MIGLKILLVEPTLHLPRDFSFQPDFSIEVSGLWVEVGKKVFEINLIEYPLTGKFSDLDNDLYIFCFKDSDPVAIKLDFVSDEESVIFLKTQYLIKHKGKIVEVLHVNAISFKNFIFNANVDQVYRSSNALPGLFGQAGLQYKKVINSEFENMKIKTTDVMPNRYVKELKKVNEDDLSQMWHSITYTGLPPATIDII